MIVLGTEFVSRAISIGGNWHGRSSVGRKLSELQIAQKLDSCGHLGSPQGEGGNKVATSKWSRVSYIDL